MKKLTFILAILMAINWANAQTLDSIAHHVLGYYGPDGMGQMENAFQMRDGNILFVHKEGINASTTMNVIGHEYYKVSRHGADIMDSLFVYDSDPPFFLFAKNPNGEDNLRIGIVRDTTLGGSFLQIFPFDNNLNFDTLNEVFVPLTDAVVHDVWNGSLITKHNDLVKLYLPWNDDPDLHLACFSLDGTLKHENVIPYSSLQLHNFDGIEVFNESPLEYVLYGRTNNNSSLAFRLFDSLLQYKDSFTITQGFLLPQGYQYSFAAKEKLLIDGDDFILASKYKRGAKNGVCLVRYDKQTLEQKKEAFFESQPMIQGGSMDLFGAYPIGLGRDKEGSFCFAYNTQMQLFTDQGQVAVVKLDADFNVLWQRFCLEPEGYYRDPLTFTMLDDGGVAVGGGYWGRPEIFMLIISDDGWTVNETKVQLRPYAYWPNPAQDELHLQFSPDVTPTQIELYDLQGRLVRTQRNGLETLEMNGLPSGAYTMRVTLEGGKVFSDKVIRE